MRLNAGITLLIGGALTCAGSAFAQADSKDFFGPNYAKEDFRGGQQNQAPAPTARPAGERPAKTPRPTRTKSATELETEAAILRLREQGALSGQPGRTLYNPSAVVGTVTAIGAILNGGDPAHAQKQMKELLELTKDSRLAAGKLYITYGTHNLISRDVSIWTLRGGVIGVIPQEVPEKYKNVKLSPTWILYTSEGEVLLEGVSSISRYLTPDGKVIEPATPTPVPPEETGSEPLIPEATPIAEANPQQKIIPDF